MNFEQAIEAHMAWKIKLRTYIGGGGDKLDAATVGKDNVCPLGQWLYGEGVKFKADPGYEKLRQKHAAFHQCASKVISTVDAGKKDEASGMLGGTSDFAKLSLEVVTLIKDIQKRVGV